MNHCRYLRVIVFRSPLFCFSNLVVVLIQGEDSVIDCVFNDQSAIVAIQASVNTGHSNNVLSNVSHQLRYWTVHV